MKSGTNKAEGTKGNTKKPVAKPNDDRKLEAKGSSSSGNSGKTSSKQEKGGHPKKDAGK